MPALVSGVVLVIKSDALELVRLLEAWWQSLLVLAKLLMVYCAAAYWPTYGMRLLTLNLKKYFFDRNAFGQCSLK